MLGTLLQRPWKLSGLARVKSVVPVPRVGVVNEVGMAEPAPVPTVANGVPVVSGERPRSGWKPLTNERRCSDFNSFCSSHVKLAMML